jgi:hypothetical protein
MADTPTTNATTPTGDPNSIRDYAVSTGKVKEWNPANAAGLFQSLGLGTSQQYLASTDKHSVFNSAMLAKLKGYSGTTDPKSISGSGSAMSGMKTEQGLSSAVGKVTPRGSDEVNIGTADKPNWVKAAPTGGTSQDSASQQPTGLSAIDTQIQQATAPYDASLNALQTTYSTNYKSTQDQKAQAMAAATQEFQKAGGDISSTGGQKYVERVQKFYDAKLEQMQGDYVVQQQQIIAQKQGAIANIKATQAQNFKDTLTAFKSYDVPPSTQEFFDALNSAIAAGIDPRQAQIQIQGAIDYSSRVQQKDALAQQKADEAERHARIMEAHALADEAIANGRLAREDRDSAVRNVNTAVDNFTKAGTTGQQLNNASSYMSSIEAAYKSGGKGVSAITLIDALVKLDTGGQAIRQGQSDLLLASGTYGDLVNTKLAKIFGASSLFVNPKIGVNSTLTSDQVSQIYDLAKEISKEKINAGADQYSQLLKGVQETKAAYPGTDGIVDATANIGNISQFINNYSDNYHYDDHTGKLWEKKADGRWHTKS